VTGPVETAVIVVSLALAAWTLVLVTLDRPVGAALLVAVGVLECLVVALLVVGLVQMVGTDRTMERATFVGYLVAAVLIPPIAAVWSLGERTRYGTTVLLVALLVMPVMVVRIQQVWTGPVGAVRLG
jgi:hypothetical protein